uniref:Ig-like domain-containing protein n=1 Tax=Timema genevievae TaxID=629358 RepID=A0A7R9JZU7_TIMGE|nr:unnamed protein product [Timema genevievae]
MNLLGLCSATFFTRYSTTLASHTLRHRQRGPSGLPRPSRDDGGEPLEYSSRPNDTFTSYSSSSPVTPSPVPPSSLPPREVTVSQHEEARLTCDLPADYSRGGDNGGSAPPRFEPVWRHGEEVVDAVKVSGSMLGRVGSLGHRFTRDSITGQLNIANVRLEDDGLWRCEDREPVTGALLATSAPIRLVVLGE